MGPKYLSLHRPIGSSLIFVSELINLSSMSWNDSLLHSLFSPELVESILCIPLSSRRPRGRVIWKLEKRDFFSLLNFVIELLETRFLGVCYLLHLMGTLLFLYGEAYGVLRF